MASIRIGICQIVVLDGDRSGNFVRIENAIGEATEGGAEIVCLPETAVLGWVNPEAHTRAFSIPGEDSDRLCGLAERYGVFLCVGLAERDGELLYDSAVLIDARGEIILKHRKMNLLSELMEPPYVAGQEVQVVETRFGRIGVLICADTHDDGILERMAALRPDLVLAPYGYAAERGAWPEHGRELERVVAHAAEKIGAVAIGTNSVGQITHGPWKGRTYGGQSVGAYKDGVIAARAKDRDRDVCLVSIHSGTGMF